MVKPLQKKFLWLLVIAFSLGCGMVLAHSDRKVFDEAVQGVQAIRKSPDFSFDKFDVVVTMVAHLKQAQDELQVSEEEGKGGLELPANDTVKVVYDNLRNELLAHYQFGSNNLTRLFELQTDKNEGQNAAFILTFVWNSLVDNLAEDCQLLVKVYDIYTRVFLPHAKVLRTDSGYWLKQEEIMEDYVCDNPTRCVFQWIIDITNSLITINTRNWSWQGKRFYSHVKKQVGNAFQALLQELRDPGSQVKRYMLEPLSGFSSPEIAIKYLKSIPYYAYPMLILPRIALLKAVHPQLTIKQREDVEGWQREAERLLKKNDLSVPSFLSPGLLRRAKFGIGVGVTLAALAAVLVAYKGLKGERWQRLRYEWLRWYVKSPSADLVAAEREKIRAFTDAHTRGELDEDAYNKEVNRILRKYHPRDRAKITGGLSPIMR